MGVHVFYNLHERLSLVPSLPRNTSNCWIKPDRLVQGVVRFTICCCWRVLARPKLRESIHSTSATSPPWLLVWQRISPSLGKIGNVARVNLFRKLGKLG